MILELRHVFEAGTTFINLNADNVKCINVMESNKYHIYLNNGDYIAIYNEFNDAEDEAREISYWIFDPDPVHNYITREGSYYN